MAKKSESPAADAPDAATVGNEGLTPDVIQEVMAKAAADAQDEGITDPEVIKDRMLAAREELTKKS